VAIFRLGLVVSGLCVLRWNSYVENMAWHCPGICTLIRASCHSILLGSLVQGLAILLLCAFLIQNLRSNLYVESMAWHCPGICTWRGGSDSSFFFCHSIMSVFSSTL
jgi:hypothetical protein